MDRGYKVYLVVKVEWSNIEVKDLIFIPRIILTIVRMIGL